DKQGIRGGYWRDEDGRGEPFPLLPGEDHHLSVWGAYVESIGKHSFTEEPVYQQFGCRIKKDTEVDSGGTGCLIEREADAGDEKASAEDEEPRVNEDQDDEPTGQWERCKAYV
ncbi:hypothetical protein FRC17_007234, partial [Serendipita sp. 399]